MVIDVLRQKPAGMKFKDLRLQVLEREIIRKQRVGELAAELRKGGLIDFPGCEARRRVPQDDYLAMAAFRPAAWVSGRHADVADRSCSRHYPTTQMRL